LQQYVGFEVITAVVMKSSVFWDITPCGPLKVNRHFGGTFRLHLHGRRISQARNQHESKWQAERILRPWRRQHVPPKRRLTFNRLHGVISQKIAHFNHEGDHERYVYCNTFQKCKFCARLTFDRWIYRCTGSDGHPWHKLATVRTSNERGDARVTEDWLIDCRAVNSYRRRIMHVFLHFDWPEENKCMNYTSH
jgi:hypothetical protein